MSKKPTIIEIAMDELEEILRRAEAKQFNDKDYETTRTVFRSYVHLLDLLKSKNVSIRRLQRKQLELAQGHGTGFVEDNRVYVCQ